MVAESLEDTLSVRSGLVLRKLPHHIIVSHIIYILPVATLSRCCVAAERKSKVF
jgi:hypothetical protein